MPVGVVDKHSDRRNCASKVLAIDAEREKCRPEPGLWIFANHSIWKQDANCCRAQRTSKAFCPSDGKLSLSVFETPYLRLRGPCQLCELGLGQPEIFAAGFQISHSELV